MDLLSMNDNFLKLTRVFTLFLALISCKNEMNISTEKTPTRSIEASCANGLLKKSDCVDKTDDAGETEPEAEPTATPSPTATATATATPTPMPPQFTDIAASYRHRCALTPEGKAYCWGRDSDGQLGNGAALTANQESPSAVDTSAMTGEKAFVKIAAALTHTCAITSEGKIWCWGDDSSGKLGNSAAGGMTLDKDAPSPLDITGMSGEKSFVELTTGDEQSCAITAEGKAWCWGDDTAGQLGNGAATTTDQHSPSAVDTSGMTGQVAFIKITSGEYHTCGITSEGVAWCWGSDVFSQLGNGAVLTANQPSPSPVDLGFAGNKQFVDISAGENHTCALNAVGQVLCWGEDDWGQLGNGAGSTGYIDVPGYVDTSGMTGEKRFTQISAASFHTCGRTSESKIWCWGSDQFYQLGNGAAITADQEVPSALDVSGITGSSAFIKVATGNEHGGCGITADGKAFCWGVDTYGQVGNGTPITASQASPSAVDTTGLSTDNAFAKLSVGHSKACGLTGSGKLWCWGGDYTQGGSTTPVAVDVSTVTGDQTFSEVYAAWDIYALATDGKVWYWDEPISTSATLVDTSGMGAEKAFVKVEIGMASHRCGVISDGTAYCWGSDASGQLGNGAAITGTQTAPSPVDTSTLTGSGIFVDIAVGDTHSCAVAADGLMFCWGQDDAGQLGNGAAETTTKVSPYAVDISGMSGQKAFAQVTIGRKTTCALTVEGKVWCWGYDDEGQLGDGANYTFGGEVSPVALDVSGMSGDKSFKKISLGYSAAYGVTTEGKVWAWGSDQYLQLGDGAVLTGGQVSPSPLDITAMSGEKAFKDVGGGFRHACALTVQGKAWCWGRDSDGELGNGATLTGNQASPTAVDDSGI